MGTGISASFILGMLQNYHVRSGKGLLMKPTNVMQEYLLPLFPSSSACNNGNRSIAVKGPTFVDILIDHQIGT